MDYSLQIQLADQLRKLRDNRTNQPAQELHCPNRLDKLSHSPRGSLSHRNERNAKIRKGMTRNARGGGRRNSQTHAERPQPKKREHTTRPLLAGDQTESLPGDERRREPRGTAANPDANRGNRRTPKTQDAPLPGKRSGGEAMRRLQREEKRRRGSRQEMEAKPMPTDQHVNLYARAPTPCVTAS